MIQVGFIGWRGVVGSVLLQRMQAKNDFQKNFKAQFFSTSQAGKTAPNLQNSQDQLQDAFDLQVLKKCDILVSCQGSDYTRKIFKPLRKANWQGFWIDASSALRSDEKSIIALDPINAETIEEGLKSGIKQYIGGNCTVSLMLLAIGGLCHNIKHIHVSTYQAFSGAGAQMIETFFNQIQQFDQSFNQYQNTAFLEKAKKAHEILQMDRYKKDYGWTLLGNLSPWIDAGLENGFTKEEQKGLFETNKILNKIKDPIVVDSTCVRVGTLRSHAQSIHIELKESMELKAIEQAILNTSPWTKIIENNIKATQEKLNPICVSNTLDIHVGRIRILNQKNHIGLFTVGDQLLWGAAEPIRRVLNMLLEFLNT